MNKLNYYYRVFATGLSFSVFGIGGLAVGLLLFPLVNVFVWNKHKRTVLGQLLIHKLFRFFVEMMRALGIMDYSVTGIERLRSAQGTLVIANHPTLIDVVMLIAFMPKVDCVIKAALTKNPFMIGPIKAANYIVNSDPEMLIEQCSQRLKAGNALIIFPEGTRSEPDKPLKFQRGAAGIALRANANFTPVVINCVPSTLTKSSKWYQIPPSKFFVTLDVKESLTLSDAVDVDGPASLAARHLTKYLQDYYSKEISVNG